MRKSTKVFRHKISDFQKRKKEAASEEGPSLESDEQHSEVSDLEGATAQLEYSSDFLASSPLVSHSIISTETGATIRESPPKTTSTVSVDVTGRSCSDLTVRSDNLTSKRSTLGSRFNYSLVLVVPTKH